MHPWWNHETTEPKKEKEKEKRTVIMLYTLFQLYTKLFYYQVTPFIESTIYL